MKLHDIREIMKLVNQSSIEELEWELDGTTVVIKKAAPVTIVEETIVEQATEVETGYQQAAATAEEVEAEEQKVEEEDQTTIISSTSIGLFYAAVTAGQSIKTGDIIGRCTIEPLQLTEEIFSTADGEVAEILAADGQLVDYGRALIAVKQK